MLTHGKIGLSSYISLNPKRLPYLVKISLLFVFVLGSGYFFYKTSDKIMGRLAAGILPKQRKIKELQDYNKDLDENVPKYEVVAKEFEEVKKGFSLQEKEFKRLDSYFKRNGELSIIVKELTTFEPRFRMEITDIKPMPLIIKPEYTQLPIDITLRCRYVDLALYIKMLEELPRLIFTESIIMDVNKGDVPYCEAKVRIFIYTAPS
ncbi:MAG: type 4a pilus biogenesis protein PilO [bacterium]